MTYLLKTLSKHGHNLAIYISAEIKLRDEKLLRRDIDFMEEFETFLGLFLSRAPARDKNKPRKVENSSIKLISQAQKFFIQIRFQLRYRKVYILQMKRKSARHFQGNPRNNLLAIAISIIILSYSEHVKL